MKITCLDQERKEAKTRFQEHAQAYVQEQLGRPMEKLTVSVSLSDLTQNWIELWQYVIRKERS